MAMLIIPKSKDVTIPASWKELKGLFKKCDKDGDGQLDKRELKEALKYLGAILPGWRAARCLRHADADGDGFVSEHELDELVRYAIKLGYTVKQTERKSMFQR
ncbi:OLC1v1016730C1 [Oldenlandia corymbosa var. corymbosa]|uniref:OLC1v1016730C1 n=1 Tax=Oldenlandia corymbosa var. corymbosa TaxID=529605 RepID=A0AAV1E7S9_OLDCO|nr:OLC1v1016730C1 [Oldenlandia corymbosa var. corymbosa]